MPFTTISWSRILVEGTAVVLSILLAFAIDAAWEERQQRTADTAQLRALLDELATHKRLLGEAIGNHRITTEVGFDVLKIFAEDPGRPDAARISDRLNKLMNFYRINAPFGALKTAMASGTLARMENVELATRLASWPTSIEDLEEEQDTGGAVLAIELFDALAELVSLRDVYALRFENPSGRGTMHVIPDVAIAGVTDGLTAPDYAPLHGNERLANELMYYVMIAQASEGEAVLAERQLDQLMDDLAACLEANGC